MLAAERKSFGLQDVPCSPVLKTVVYLNLQWYKYGCESEYKHINMYIAYICTTYLMLFKHSLGFVMTYSAIIAMVEININLKNNLNTLK